MEWISIKDRLPELQERELCKGYSSSEPVLVCDGEHIFISFVSSCEGSNPHFYRDDSDNQITHWMPLPELPKD